MENTYEFKMKDLIPLCIGEYFRFKRLDPKDIPLKMPIKTLTYHWYQGISTGLAVHEISKGLENLLQ